MEKRRKMNFTCTLCRGAEENIFHIICSCSMLSSSLYRSIRDDQIAKSINYELKQQFHPTDSQQHSTGQTPLKITKTKEHEIWWNKLVKTTVNLRRPKVFGTHTWYQRGGLSELPLPPFPPISRTAQNMKFKFGTLIVQLI